MEDLEYKIAKLSLAPGDVLVVKLDSPVAHHDVLEMIRADVSRAVGERVPVLILGGDIDLSVLTRAEADTKGIPLDAPDLAEQWGKPKPPPKPTEVTVSFGPVPGDCTVQTAAEDNPFGRHRW